MMDVTASAIVEKWEEYISLQPENAISQYLWCTDVVYMVWVYGCKIGKWCTGVSYGCCLGVTCSWHLYVHVLLGLERQAERAQQSASSVIGTCGSLERDVETE